MRWIRAISPNAPAPSLDPTSSRSHGMSPVRVRATRDLASDEAARPRAPRSARRNGPMARNCARACSHPAMDDAGVVPFLDGSSRVKINPPALAETHAMSISASRPGTMSRASWRRWRKTPSTTSSAGRPVRPTAAKPPGRSTRPCSPIWRRARSSACDGSTATTLWSTRRSGAAGRRGRRSGSTARDARSHAARDRVRGERGHPAGERLGRSRGHDPPVAAHLT